MDILTSLGLAAGIALLFLGRRLYWILVLGLGSATGFTTALHYGLAPSEFLLWVIGVSSGLAAVLLARLLPRAAIWATGFVAGAYALALLLLVLNFLPAVSIWGVQLGGAVLGLVCFGLWFDWGLTILSVFIGAGLITNTLDLGVPARPLGFLALLAIGMVCQRRLPSRSKSSSEVLNT